ncbi:hypothetical protein CPB83DRAFT_853806 [Crepidotus variabilis]|uniref:Uncharacterized protein n=1 Tax=Crepidotus variabilis TaxID=179855 RepID=A0A9P6JQG5_9AGAR|nr:hypothetical protein CPB83DRAFT_853806 [Crepidotus variabilis]
MANFDFNRYVWRKDADVAGRYIREAGGGEVIEDIWKLTKHGEQNLFLGIQATLSVPIEAALLHEHVKHAWTSLRWEVPIIAATTSHIWHTDKPPTAFIVYDVGKSHSDVDKWVSETLEVKADYKNKTLDDLRYDIGQEPIPVNDYDRQTFLYLVPYTPTTFGLLLRTAHTTVDGSGIKIWLTKLLTHLEKYISHSKYRHGQKESFKWGTEGERLLPIITEVLRKHEPAVVENGVVISEELPVEPRDGKEYFETLQGVMGGIVEGHSRQHLFKSFIQPPFDPATSKPKTKRCERRFSVEDSVKIKAAGYNLDPNNKLTINHIVHGTLSLLPLFDNPPAPDSDGAVFYYGLADGRKRLAKEYRGPLDYPGYCLGVSGLQIPISIFNKYSTGDKKTLVYEFAKEMKKEYLKQAAYPALVGIEAQQGDIMLHAPPPPPWAGPGYSADGKGSLYLYPKYPPAEEGPVVVEITDFFLGLNKCDPGPFFRCYEWNGSIVFSVDYNEYAVAEKVINEWMDMWVDLTSAITK